MAQPTQLISKEPEPKALTREHAQFTADGQRDDGASQLARCTTDAVDAARKLRLNPIDAPAFGCDSAARGRFTVRESRAADVRGAPPKLASASSAGSAASGVAAGPAPAPLGLFFGGECEWFEHVSGGSVQQSRMAFDTPQTSNVTVPP